jgi:recombinational DNA repair protein RecR
MVKDLTELECISTVPSSIQNAWMGRTTCVERKHENCDDDSRMSRTLFVVRSEDDEMLMDNSFSSDYSHLTNNDVVELDSCCT